MERYITAKQIYRAIPTLKWYTLEYLIRTGKIKPKSFGKGVQRKFPPETISKIRRILSERS